MCVVCSLSFSPGRNLKPGLRSTGLRQLDKGRCCCCCSSCCLPCCCCFCCCLVGFPMLDAFSPLELHTSCCTSNCCCCCSCIDCPFPFSGGALIGEEGRHCCCCCCCWLRCCSCCGCSNKRKDLMLRLVGACLAAGLLSLILLPYLL